MYKEKVINYIDVFLAKNSFFKIEKGDRTAAVFEYSKLQNDINFGIEFLPDIYKNGHFWGFSFVNRISILENIVTKILYETEIIAVKPYEISYSIHFKYEDQYMLPTAGILIDSEEKVKEVCFLFDKFYSEYFLPFYQKWSSLNALYEFVKDKEGREELNDILGQFWQFKKAAILRLCNDKNYQKYMDTIYEREKKYFEEAPNDIDNIRYYNAAKELKELLDKTEPVYNV